MPIMTLQILKSVDLKKKQQGSRYLENETFFLQKKIKKSKATLLQKNSFVEEVTFKTFCLQ